MDSSMNMWNTSCWIYRQEGGDLVNIIERNMIKEWPRTLTPLKIVKWFMLDMPPKMWNTSLKLSNGSRWIGCKLSNKPRCLGCKTVKWITLVLPSKPWAPPWNSRWILQDLSTRIWTPGGNASRWMCYPECRQLAEIVTWIMLDNVTQIVDASLRWSNDSYWSCIIGENVSLCVSVERTHWPLKDIDLEYRC